MPRLYPLRFEPIFRRYVWGGRRLAAVLDKPLGEGDDYAESWEIVDRGLDQSRVTAGPLAGRTLSELIKTQGRELLGRHAPVERFPLLIKFLDARQTLSVQVHPGDEQAAKLTPPDLGKTEAWVVLAAEPGSLIYAGLKQGVDRDALARAIADGSCERCLHRVEPKPGDCIFLPAGAVHALGAGLLVAEIQQSSDTTYRLFDWNRLDREGKPRPLHVEQALGVIDFELGPLDLQSPQPTDRSLVEQLAACDKFVIDRWHFATPQHVGGDGRGHVLMVLDGAVDIEGDPAATPLARGATALVPAEVGPLRLDPQVDSILLDVYLP